MVNGRIYVAPGPNTMNRNLRSRLYSSSDTKARPVGVTTRCAGQLRFPFVESVVGNTPLQPYVHDCVVTVIDGPRTHRYVVFFKRHRALPSNALISRLCYPLAFRGDIVVMRIGSRHGHVVNMRPGDAVVANLVIAKFVSKASAAVTSRTLPRAMKMEIVQGGSLGRSRRRSSRLML